MNAKELIKLLEWYGWRKDIGGRHVVMIKNGKRVPIPVHGNKDIKIGTLKAIERSTGVKTK